MLDRYMNRPDEVSKWKICFKEFFMFCRIPWISSDSAISGETDWQPVELTDDMLETNLTALSHYPSPIPLMSSPEKLECWKVPSVLRHFMTNKNRNCEG